MLSMYFFYFCPVLFFECLYKPIIWTRVRIPASPQKVVRRMLSVYGLGERTGELDSPIILQDQAGKQPLKALRLC